MPRPKDSPPALPTFLPVPREKDRANGWKPEVQLKFIEALAETGSVKAACARVNRADHGAYLLRRHPAAESFRRAWDAALDIGMRRIEDVAMERALNGVEVPVYSYGKLIGTRTVYNDRLLMFMLRNRAPERFAAHRPAPKGPDAIGRMELNRLKKQWRKEWEEERRRDDAEADGQALTAIDAMLARKQANWLASMTRRTRALYEAWKAAEAEDEAAGRTAYNDAEAEAEDAEEDDEAEWEARALPGPRREPDWREG